MVPMVYAKTKRVEPLIRQMDREHEKRLRAFKDFKRQFSHLTDQEILDELAFNDWKFTGSLNRKKSAHVMEQANEDKKKYRQMQEKNKISLKNKRVCRRLQSTVLDQETLEKQIKKLKQVAK
jgi:hypothetical protein